MDRINSSAARQILHLDLDTFFVSCERLREPKLVGKPILIGADSDRFGNRKGQSAMRGNASMTDCA